MGRKLSVILISIVLFQSAVVHGQERVKLRISSATKTFGYGPLWVASQKGFFERQGLDVELVVIRASDVGIQALAGGSLEIAGSASDAPIAAIEKGLDLVIVGGIINGLSQSIMAAKKFKTYADLRGATFGARARACSSFQRRCSASTVAPSMSGWWPSRNRNADRAARASGWIMSALVNAA